MGQHGLDVFWEAFKGVRTRKLHFSEIEIFAIEHVINWMFIRACRRE